MIVINFMVPIPSQGVSLMWNGNNVMPMIGSFTDCISVSWFAANLAASQSKWKSLSITREKKVTFHF